MKIGFDATILGSQTQYSGIGRYSLRLMNSLAAADNSNEYIAYGPPASARPQDLDRAWQWKPLPQVRLGKLSNLVTAVRNLPRLAAGDDLDLFHVPTVHPRPSWPAVPRGIPCPLVVTLHDLIPLTHYSRGPGAMPLRWRLYYRWNLHAAARAAAVITVSETSRREIAGRLKIHPGRLRVIYNGIDVPPREDISPRHSADAPFVLYVGSFEPRKNLMGAVRAHTRALGRGLPYDLVVVAAPGSGPAAPVRSEMAAAGFEDRVWFLNAVSDERLWDLYRRAAFFVFPSLAEGFGLPPLEAMAAGTPVIASDLPAHRELLGNRVVFVDPESEEALAGAMLELAASAERRRELGRGGPQHAAQYTWRRCAEQTLEVYRDVCGAHVAAAGVDCIKVGIA